MALVCTLLKAALWQAVWSLLVDCALMASMSQSRIAMLCPIKCLFSHKARLSAQSKWLLATRRGPAAEAQSLYEDLDPPQPRMKAKDDLRAIDFEVREKGSGRPTKKDRRRSDALKNLL